MPKNNEVPIVIGYIRLSSDDFDKTEKINDEAISKSIANQKRIIDDFVQRRFETSVTKYFIDDGFSGGNFNRPAFKEMIEYISAGKCNYLITKDLSRLGRKMDECCYYAEQYFPENGVHFLTVLDSFDSSNVAAFSPLQMAFNETYIRQVSSLVKNALETERKKGLYCACPPYGYKKLERDRNHLCPDEETAPVVQRIFDMAANGLSTLAIAAILTEEKVYPPLKYRALCRDKFKDSSLDRVTDTWNDTTVKRILKNQVYLGHTILGKCKKVSFRSKKKVKKAEEEWAISRNTHEPLVSEETFRQAQLNMAKGTRKYEGNDRIRISMFSGIAYCARCGHALCSAGTVYKGEREKYWYLTCTHMRKGIDNHCDGVRIRYTDLVDVVKEDLNSLIDLSDEQIDELIKSTMNKVHSEASDECRKKELEKAEARIVTINKIVMKLYLDNAEGRISDSILYDQINSFEKERASLNEKIEELSQTPNTTAIKKDYEKFFLLAKQYTHIEELTRDILLTFIDRIEVGPKILQEGVKVVSHRNQPFEQSIKIYYRFIGDALSQNSENIAFNM